MCLNSGRIYLHLTIYKDITLVRVELRQNESQRKLMKRFRKSVARSGKLKEVRRRRWYISKGEQRRLAKKKAIRRKKLRKTRRRMRK
jgi:small subunit ribosomal protein S21